MVDILEDILAREGWPKFTDDPTDRGGPTKGGITLKELSGFYGRTATLEELKALTKDEARKLLYATKIKRPGFNRILNVDVRNYVIDFAVNSGQDRATRYLQKTVNTKVDGILGPQTATATNTQNGTLLLLKLVIARCIFLCSIVDADTTQIKYIEGWIDRATYPLVSLAPEIKEACVRIAAAAQEEPAKLLTLRADMQTALKPLAALVA